MRNIYSKSEALCNKTFTTILCIFSIILLLLSLSLDTFNKIFYTTFIITFCTIGFLLTIKNKTLKHLWNLSSTSFVINLFLRLFGCIDVSCFILTSLSAPVMMSAVSRLSLQLFFDGIIKPAHDQRKRYERYTRRHDHNNRGYRDKSRSNYRRRKF